MTNETVDRFTLAEDYQFETIEPEKVTVTAKVKLPTKKPTADVSSSDEEMDEPLVRPAAKKPAAAAASAMPLQSTDRKMLGE